MGKDKEKFFAWVRRHHCCLCGGFDDIDETSGEPLTTVSHVKTRGSGGGDFDNVLPMCTPCHSRFEGFSRTTKQKYLPAAKKLTKKYLLSGKDSSHCPYFKNTGQAHADPMIWNVILITVCVLLYLFAAALDGKTFDDLRALNQDLECNDPTNLEVTVPCSVLP